MTKSPQVLAVDRKLWRELSLLRNLGSLKLCVHNCGAVGRVLATETK